MRIIFELRPDAFDGQAEAYGDMRRYFYRLNNRLAELVAQAKRDEPGVGELVSQGPSQEGIVFGYWRIEK